MLLILMVFVEVARGMHIHWHHQPTIGLTMTLQTIAAIVSKIKACQTVADLDALWLQEIGYSVLSENPECTAEQLRADLFDYAREMCFDAGYHCIDAAIPSE